MNQLQQIKKGDKTGVTDHGGHRLTIFNFLSSEVLYIYYYSSSPYRNKYKEIVASKGAILIIKEIIATQGLPQNNLALTKSFDLA
jgi:hypothetical protein